MKLLFVGDCVIKNPGTFNLPKEINPKDYEYVVCNLEAPIADEGDATFKKVGPSVRQSEDSVKAIKNAGFNICLLANNHIMDYGVAGLKRTIEYLDAQGILHTGAGFDYDAYTPLVLEDNGEKAVIINITEAQFGVAKNERVQAGYAWLGYRRIPYQIQNFKEKGYFVIVCCHAGLENYKNPLPEWKYFYRGLADYGADCVIASHPHIVQGFEKYNNCYIYYSLGNYYFDNSSTKNFWNTGMIVSVDTGSGTCKEAVTYFDGNSVSLFDNGVDFDSLNQTIGSDDELDRIANEIAEKTWTDYYRKYYENCFNVKETILGKIQRKIGAQYAANAINEPFLLHNLQIESHRYLVERYLYNKNTSINNISQK